MTPEQALAYKRRGGKLAENVDLHPMARIFNKLLTPPAQDVTPVKDLTVVVRETFYPSRTDIADLLTALRESRYTGRLNIDLRDGGISAIRVREEVHIDAT